MASRKDFESAVGDRYFYRWTDGSSGIGICRDGRTAVLFEKGALKRYNVNQFRGHNATIASTQVYGRGMQAASAQIGAAIADSRNSGFYIRVKDVDHPRWRIPIKAEKDQVVWDEIMLQFYEGVFAEEADAAAKTA